jgi:hypothetical protein
MMGHHGGSKRAVSKCLDKVQLAYLKLSGNVRIAISHRLKDFGSIGLVDTIRL